MKALEIKATIFEMKDEGTLTLPYGCGPIFDQDINNQKDWDKIQWNPAHGQQAEKTPDPNASAKPTFAVLKRKFRESRVNANELIRMLNNDCRNNAIPSAYGVKTFEKEMIKKMNGQTTAEQDAERDRLVALCNTIENQIENTSQLTVLERIRDQIEDGSWKNIENG